MSKPAANEHASNAPHSRLELDSEGRSHQLILTRDGLSECFEVRLKSCTSPVCHCPTVDLSCRPADEGATGDEGRFFVSLDVFSECAEGPPADAESYDEEVAHLVADGMDRDQWRLLRKWMTLEKRRQMVDMDLDSLDVSFDPAVRAEGLMAAYTDIFPFAERPTFEAESGSWMVEDQYCVQPRCRCTDAVLSFFLLPKESDDPSTADTRPGGKPLKEQAAVRYELRRRSWKIDSSTVLSPPETRRLVEALELARPDLISLLETRRKQLRRLYKRSLAEVHEPDPAPPRFGTKVGRNEPCPCGSGRKYKRCCGR
jgi:hypothetical protein